MVLIKAGSYQRLNQRVTLYPDFWIGKYEVTQGEYSALTGKNPSHFSGNPNSPVEKVTHLDASNFCVALTLREREAGHLPNSYEYRLPSEAEWEFACRAGSTNAFSFGEDPKDADAYAWTEENSNGSTHPVGLKLPNAWGLYDMHGNIWEWCRDGFADYPTQAATNPVAPAVGKFRVFRGGGWNQQAKFARCASRFMMSPSNGISFVGFRLALTVTNAPGR